MCQAVYPDDKSQIHCPTEDCPGRRYVKNAHTETKDWKKQATNSFIFSDVKVQLQNLLQLPGNFIITTACVLLVKKV